MDRGVPHIARFRYLRFGARTGGRRAQAGSCCPNGRLSRSCVGHRSGNQRSSPRSGPARSGQRVVEDRDALLVETISNGFEKVQTVGSIDPTGDLGEHRRLTGRVGEGLSRLVRSASATGWVL